MLWFGVMLAVPAVGQDRGAFAWLTPLPGIVAEAVDVNGNLYVTGTASGSFAATPGAFQNQPKACAAAGCSLIYVAKLNPTGQIVYAALLGGGDVQRATGIAVDSAGNAVVTGNTCAADFPTTAGAFQTVLGDGRSLGYCGDAFITKLNSTGSALIFSTFIGGSAEDSANFIALDSLNNVYIGGQTNSNNFPVTAGAFEQRANGNGFLTKVKPDGSGLVFSTYFYTSVAAIALDAASNAYIAGVAPVEAPFVATPGAFQSQVGGPFASAYAAKFSADGTQLLFATFLGGSGQDYADSVAVDKNGNVFVGGTSRSSNFPVAGPTTVGRNQSFLAEFSPDGSRLISAFSPGGDMVRRVWIAADGSTWVFGSGDATPLGGPIPGATAFPLGDPIPITSDAFQKNTTGDFVEHLAANGALIYCSTIFQGPPLALDASGNVYVGGGVADAAGKIDLSIVSTNSIIANVVNAGTFDSYAITPGEVVSIFGDRIGPSTGVVYTPDAQGRAPLSLGGVSVTVNGIPAPLIYAQASQINAIVPWQSFGYSPAQVVVQYGVATSVPFTTAISDSVPGIFQLPGVAGAPHQAAVINQDGAVNSPANPAPLGSIVSMYVTGLGAEMPVPADGTITTDATHLAVNPITVSFFGGVTGQVLYAGGAPGLLAGVSQLNVRLPQAIPGVVNTSAVTVSIRSGMGFASAVGPTIAVR